MLSKARPKIAEVASVTEFKTTLLGNELSNMDVILPLINHACLNVFALTCRLFIATRRLLQYYKLDKLLLLECIRYAPMSLKTIKSTQKEKGLKLTIKIYTQMLALHLT